jgi:protein O-GlcNAc transferase
MEPHMSDNDKAMFYKYLDKSHAYFEYGSGGSTYQASIRENIAHVYSVESDITWANTIRNQVNLRKVTLFMNDMGTLPHTWGNPGPNSKDEDKIAYSNYLRTLSKGEQSNIDLVLIDGRFRVACCLKCFDIIGSNCVIAFDDFLDRPQYHVVLDYYDIIEKTEDNRMVILKKKIGHITVPSEVIRNYELISA